MGAVTPDLSAPQFSLFLREGYLDVVLRLLVCVNPLEILLFKSFRDILEFDSRYLEIAFEDNDADFIFVIIVFQRDV